MIAPKTKADRKAAKIVAIAIVVCIVALLVVDRLPIPDELKKTIKRTLWTAILAGLGLVLLGVAAVGLPWTLAAGLAAGAFAAAGGVWALGSIVQAATGGGGTGGEELEDFCPPGQVRPDGTVCLGLEF